MHLVSLPESLARAKACMADPGLLSHMLDPLAVYFHVGQLYKAPDMKTD